MRNSAWDILKNARKWNFWTLEETPVWKSEKIIDFLKKKVKKKKTLMYKP